MITGHLNDMSPVNESVNIGVLNELQKLPLHLVCLVLLNCAKLSKNNVWN